MENRALIVYTGPTLEQPAPSTPLYSLSTLSIAPKPIGWTTNPVDLDVWLKSHAGQVGSQRLTHASLLKNIGDTIGSHLDQDILPSIVMLRSTAVPMQGIPREMLVLYLGRVGAVTLMLAEQILRGAKGERDPRRW